jgi:IclR family transcriptional regulator, acetate operon repressor
MASEPVSQTIATVERAIDVLALFTRTDSRTLGVTEIAGELGLSKAAVHRILASLRGRGLISLDEASRRYALGPMALALGNAYQSRVDVREAAAGELRRLSADAQETATLSVLAGESRVYVDQVTPDR